MGSLSLLQWIFLTQELNHDLLHSRRILYLLSYEGSPYFHVQSALLSISSSENTHAMYYTHEENGFCVIPISLIYFFAHHPFIYSLISMKLFTHLLHIYYVPDNVCGMWR